MAEPETQQQLSYVPLELTMNYLVNGRSSQVKTVRVNLPVSHEHLSQDATLRWELGAQLDDVLQREEGVTYRARKSRYPFQLTMGTDDARAFLLSEEPATAVVELPVTAEVEEGREIIRDGDGRAQASVERKFCNLSWDTSWHRKRQESAQALVRSMGTFGLSQESA